jgi:hypothetical protein
VRASDELALPLGGGKTSPISAVDVARAVAVMLDDPAPHIGQIYDLTGPESADLDHYARVFSEALGRPIRYRDVPLPAWSESLRHARFPEHVVRHLSAMAELTRRGRYDRMADTMCKLTGDAPTNMRDFVKLHAAEFKQRGRHFLEALIPGQTGGDQRRQLYSDHAGQRLERDPARLQPARVILRQERTAGKTVTRDEARRIEGTASPICRYFLSKK